MTDVEREVSNILTEMMNWMGQYEGLDADELPEEVYGEAWIMCWLLFRALKRVQPKVTHSE